MEINYLRREALPRLEQQTGRTKAIAELTDAIGSSHEVLVSVSTVFPFTLFPDAVTIDRTKMTITKRSFFKMGEVVSIRIEDVLNVAATVGPFFGTIKIATRFFDTQKAYEVRYLWRSDALKIKRILQGYVIATKKKVDCAALGTAELAGMLEELGKGAPVEEL